MIWATFLAYSLLTLFLFLVIAGFVLNFFLPFGNLVILLASVSYALLTNFELMGLKTLFVLIFLYSAGEILEYLMVVVGTKKWGGSNASVWGGVVGGILGVIFGAGFFGVGAFFGGILGVFLGAFLIEYALKKDLIQSLKSGTGGVIGRISSVFLKLIVSLLMIILILIDLSL